MGIFAGDKPRLTVWGNSELAILWSGQTVVNENANGDIILTEVICGTAASALSETGCFLQPCGPRPLLDPQMENAFSCGLPVKVLQLFP